MKNPKARSSKVTHTLRFAVTTVAMVSAAIAVTAANDNWPHFRGPTMNAAVADNPDLPEQWSATENVEWATEIPGIGWSSPVVWGNRVFLTTVTAEGDFEQPKPGLYAPNGRPDPVPLEHDWRVYCLDLETGDVVWQRSVRLGFPEFPRHMKNSYASETPTTDGERVYVRFGELGLFTFDMDGNEVWSLAIPDRQTRSEWGSASSPVVHEEKLIILYDNEEESWISALDKRTGEEIWRTARDEVSTWATPYVWEHDGRTEIVTSGVNRIRSYDLDGGLLWEMNGHMSWATIATPFSSHGLVYVNSGYFRDERRPAYAIRPGASGDISLKDGEVANEFVAWYQPKAGNYNTSPLVYGDIYYSLLDRGFFESYDALTGDPVYGRQRLSVGSSFTSSPWAYNGKIFALSEQGETYVIRAGRQFEVVGVNSLDEMAMASPAIVGDRLLIRTQSKVYSIRNEAD
jgi:outer membrane protein assembly factor BamB